MVDFDGIFLCSVLRRHCNNCWTHRLLLTNITFTYVCFSPASQMVQGAVNGRVVSTVATDRLSCAQRKLRKTEGASTGSRQYPVSPRGRPWRRDAGRGIIRQFFPVHQLSRRSSWISTELRGERLTELCQLPGLRLSLGTSCVEKDVGTWLARQ